MRDWNVWLTFRVYSIYFILILDVIFSQDGFLIFEQFNNSIFSPENRMIPALESAFQIISIGLGVYLITNWGKSIRA